jgi:hypothetical protein
MMDGRNLSGRFTPDARRQELVRQLMRARRTVVADRRIAGEGDPGKQAMVERVKRWTPGESPGALPGAPG